MSDLIRKQDAIELIRSMEYDATSHGISPRLTPSHVINSIESLQSAEETGKWVERDNGYFFCSKCGKYPENQVSKTDFCPNCGAKMGGDTE